MDQIPEKVTIRLATVEDCALIEDLIRKHGKYQKATDKQLTVSAELIKTNVFEKKYCEFLIAEVNNVPVGFSCFLHNFSTWLGKAGLWIEDLFVFPEYRKQKIGLRLMQKMAQICQERDCPRLDWTVMTWNELAIGFYKKLGSEQMNEWIAHRLDFEGINALANMKI